MTIIEWTPDVGDMPAPGAYSGMPERLYHRGPALSSTGAKKLLSPSTPAHYRWWKDNGQDTTSAMEHGSAAHTVVLGTGKALHVVQASNWTTKAAREERDMARDIGRIPVLEREYEELLAMADAIRAHPIAGWLFQRQRYEGGALIEPTGTPEVSLFWRDPLVGIDKRARLDWVPNVVSPAGSLIVGDYKTCVSADDESCDQAIRSYGYHRQADWNTEGLYACGLDRGAPVLFVLVFQEKKAPYLVNVRAVEAQTLKVAQWRNHQAAEVFRQCTESGVWPGYPERIGYAQLPYWDLKRELEAMG